MAWEEGILIKDIRRQLRKGQGPIYWTRIFLEWLLVQLARLVLGCRLDVPPEMPSAFGVTARTSSSVVVKWIPKLLSKYSAEQYRVQVGNHCADGAQDAAEWRQIDELQSGDSCEIKDLDPDTSYVARVRSYNSKGESEWREHTFRTKQQPVKGGGVGPGYTWTQDHPLDAVEVTVALAKSTRAKDLEISVRPNQLRIVHSGEVLLEGPLYSEVQSSESDWELVDLDGRKDLVLTIPKKRENTPWPSIVRGHPEIDVRGLKRKTAEEIRNEKMQEELETNMAKVREKLGIEEMAAYGGAYGGSPGGPYGGFSGGPYGGFPPGPAPTSPWGY